MSIAALKDFETYKKIWKSIRYSTYCMFHPIDGFWCLSREKRGSFAAANVLMAAMMLVEILRVTVTNFQFVTVNPERYNAIFSALSMLVPMVLWALANWCLTTLLDGKGRLKDVYIATVFAFTPNLIINAVMIPISHVITFDESVIYRTALTAGLIWSVLLVLCAMMMVHDYTLTKAVASSILTIVGIGVIIFIFLLFFSLISDGIAYFVSIYKEISFRLY